MTHKKSINLKAKKKVTDTLLVQKQKEDAKQVLYITRI